MFSKKAQAAMEFLMTYGWAILVVLIVIGVFWQLGVFNNLLVSEKCVIGGGWLNCKDYLVEGDKITLQVQNAVGTDLEVSLVNVSSSALVSPCYNDTNHIIRGSESADIFADGCTYLPNIGNQRNKYSITITYRQLDAQYNKTLLGELTASKQG